MAVATAAPAATGGRGFGASGGDKLGVAAAMAALAVGAAVVAMVVASAFAFDCHVIAYFVI